MGLTGESGLLQQLTKVVLESALEGEMDGHLWYGKHDPAGRNGENSRNGKRTKTMLTEAGPVELEVPRDRNGSFEPVIVKKRQRRLDGIDGIVLSLSAKGSPTARPLHIWPRSAPAASAAGPGDGRCRLGTRHFACLWSEPGYQGRLLALSYRKPRVVLAQACRTQSFQLAPHGTILGVGDQLSNAYARAGAEPYHEPNWDPFETTRSASKPISRCSSGTPHKLPSRQHPAGYRESRRSAGLTGDAGSAPSTRSVCGQNPTTPVIS
ncbi:hypothetical protein GCM10027569_22360 [Flindersiella endophytica]